MSIEIGPPVVEELKPRIAVIGVGGAGGNAIANMIAAEVEGVDFIVANTDAQALNSSPAERRIQLGPRITEGLGAGSRPEIGRAAAEETLTSLEELLDGAHMCFIAAGMGGGTGTGAAPVIAKAARDRGILTVGVVTKPFTFEGSRRAKAAEAGIEELQKHVDTLIVIPNQNLFLVANPNTTFKEAFQMADEVLQQGVRGITDLMVMPGLINLDFADVRSVMGEMGKAMMGAGEADGDGRALTAAERAIANPLLDGVSMRGAKGVIINITGGDDLRLMEVDEAANHIRQLVDPDANIIVGSAFNDSLNGKIRVSVVATGIDPNPTEHTQAQPFAFTARPAPAPARTEFSAPASAPVETSFESAAAPEPVAEESKPFTAYSSPEPAAEQASSDGSESASSAADEAVSSDSEFAPAQGLAFSPPSNPNSDDDEGDELLLGDDAVADADKDAASVATESPFSAPGDSTAAKSGGTLFERMAGLSRGIARAHEESDEAADKPASPFPQFLNRQGNQ